jgi:hypothetical protein
MGAVEELHAFRLRRDLAGEGVDEIVRIGQVG